MRLLNIVRFHRNVSPFHIITLMSLALSGLLSEQPGNSKGIKNHSSSNRQRNENIHDTRFSFSPAALCADEHVKSRGVVPTRGVQVTDSWIRRGPMWMGRALVELRAEPSAASRGQSGLSAPGGRVGPVLRA